MNGVAGYLLMSTPVRRVIERALKGRSPEAIAALSDRAGPWGIALSRSLPYSIPEAMVCLAGLARPSNVPRLAWFWQHLRRCSTPGSAPGLGILLALVSYLPIALSAVLYLTRRRSAGVVEEPPPVVRMRRPQ